LQQDRQDTIVFEGSQSPQKKQKYNNSPSRGAVLSGQLCVEVLAGCLDNMNLMSLVLMRLEMKKPFGTSHDLKFTL